MVVVVAIQVVGLDSQRTRHHNALTGTPPMVLNNRGAAIVCWLQLCNKKPTDLSHVLVVIHVAVSLVPTQLPLGGADGRRTSPVAGD